MAVGTVVEYAVSPRGKQIFNSALDGTPLGHFNPYLHPSTGRLGLRSVGHIPTEFLCAYQMVPNEGNPKFGAAWVMAAARAINLDPWADKGERALPHHITEKELALETKEVLSDVFIRFVNSGKDDDQKQRYIQAIKDQAATPYEEEYTGYGARGGEVTTTTNHSMIRFVEEVIAPLSAAAAPVAAAVPPPAYGDAPAAHDDAPPPYSPPEAPTGLLVRVLSYLFPSR